MGTSIPIFLPKLCGVSRMQVIWPHRLTLFWLYFVYYNEDLFMFLPISKLAAVPEHDLH